GPIERLRLLLEIQRGGVDAPALAGRLRTVVEHVPQVRAAAPAADLGPHHEEAAVLAELSVGQVHRLGEARPAGAGVELGVRPEELSATGSAVVGAVGVCVPVLPGEGSLRAVLPQHVELLRRELLTPFALGFLDSSAHGSHSTAMRWGRRGRGTPRPY